MNNRVSIIKAPLLSGKTSLLLDLIYSKTSTVDKWLVLSCCPKRRQELKKLLPQVAIIDPHCVGSLFETKIVWLDEWQSMGGKVFHHLHGELSGSSALIFLSQSFEYSFDKKFFNRMFFKQKESYLWNESCLKVREFKHKNTLYGHYQYERDAQLALNPKQIPAPDTIFFYYPFSVDYHSDVLAKARSVEIAGILTKKFINFNELVFGLWARHLPSRLLCLDSETNDRRNHFKEDALSRSASYLSVTFKKWAQVFRFILWRTRGRKKDEAKLAGAWAYAKSRFIPL